MNTRTKRLSRLASVAVLAPLFGALPATTGTAHAAQESFGCGGMTFHVHEVRRPDDFVQLVGRTANGRFSAALVRSKSGEAYRFGFTVDTRDASPTFTVAPQRATALCVAYEGRGRVRPSANGSQLFWQDL